MPPTKIFKGVVFCISGKLSQTRKDYEEQITKYGGTLAGSVTTAVTYLISSEDDVKASPVKVAAAMGRGVPILQEGFVGACIGAKKLLGHEFFIVKGSKRKAAPKGAPRPAKKVKVVAIPPGPVKTTDKVAVFPKSFLVGKAEVVVTETKAFGKTSLIWDAELLLSDPAKGKDKFFNIQLLASVPEKNQFYCCHHWGKTGMDGTVYVDGPYDDAEPARQSFKKKYRSKTGNVWGAVDATFIEVPGKYKLLNRADGKAEDDHRWQYYLHNKVDGKKIGWYDYDKDAAKNIEKYWRQYNTNEGLGVRLVQSDYFKYEVNFTEMFQTNTKSGMRRVIRRLKAGEKPDAAAPAKIPDPVDPKPDAADADESEEDDDEDDAVEETGSPRLLPSEGEVEEEEVEEGAEPAAAAAAGEAEEAKPAAGGRKAPPAEAEAEEAPKPAAGGRKAPPDAEAVPPAEGGGRKAPDAADAETEAGSPVPAAAGDDDETMAPTLPMDGLKKRGA